VDARITKTRLSNLLSYDWLKIIVAAAMAITALCVFFTMVKTRAEDEQTFSVYSYDLTSGSDFMSLDDDLKDRDVFSYEILSRQVESLGSSSDNSYSGMLYTTRLTNTDRTVMLVGGLSDSESDGYSAVYQLIDVDANGNNGFIDVETYLSECEAYLGRFFGQDLAGELEDVAVRDSFYARNTGDKRFRSEAKQEEGIAKERERIEKLRRDYLTVRAAFEDGTYTYSTLTVSEEAAESADDGIAAGEYRCGVSLSKLSNLRELCYRSVEKDGVATMDTSDVCLLIFRTDALGNTANDLRYETISFLAYLLSQYGG